MQRKCPGCQSIYVCWNWVAPTLNYKQWSHECWACGNGFSTNDEVTDGILYEKLNSPEAKAAAESERKAIICHKLKDNDFFVRLCGEMDKKGKWTRSESDWDQVTCMKCLEFKPR